MNLVPRLLASTLFASRWLLAPIYMGLGMALLAMGIKFAQELIHLFLHIWTLHETDTILLVLTLVDFALVASLLVMVILAGYENFISSIEEELGTKLSWIGQLDAGGLKIKVASSLVAISSVNLLQQFMDLEKVPPQQLLWYVLIHLTFVISAVSMAFLNKIVKCTPTNAPTTIR